MLSQMSIVRKQENEDEEIDGSNIAKTTGSMAQRPMRDVSVGNLIILRNVRQVSASRKVCCIPPLRCPFLS